MATKKTTKTTKTTPKNKTSGPIRREVWAAVCFFLGFFSLLAVFGIEAPILTWISVFLKWILGYAFYLMPICFICISLVLLFHHGRPVSLRILFIALTVLDISALLHLFLCRQTYVWTAKIWEVFIALGNDGVRLLSGGALGGFTSFLLSSLISSIGCGFVLIASLPLLLMGALRISFSQVGDYLKRERPQYTPEPEYDPQPVRPNPAPIQRPVSKGHAVSPPISAYDIPLDDAPVSSRKNSTKAASEEKKKGSLFSSSTVKSPADVALEQKNRNYPKAESPIDIPLPEPVLVTSSDPIPVTKPESKPDSVPNDVPDMTNLPPLKEEKDKTPIVIPDIDTTLPQNQTYQFPPISLLEKGTGSLRGNASDLKARETQLVDTIRSFGIEVRIVEAIQGPAVTRYELQMDSGIKLSKLTGLSQDIALRLGATNVRIAPVPGKGSIVGVEIPNTDIATVRLRDVIDSAEFKNHKSNIAFTLGKDITGKCIIGDIAKLPHMLIAGTTGSGKSVCTNSLILSLLYKSSPEDVRLILIDPKMVELGIYNGIPHLLIPVVTDPKKAAGALQWAVTEMMRRYKLFSGVNVRDMTAYNNLVAKNPEIGEKLPQIVIIIDELADLMMIAAKEVEEAICRIAQMARAAGMHLIIATQRPSADVITGLMKANIPSRIAFAVASAMESRIILDMQGAEKLIGRGDMLFLPLGTARPIRIQGTFVTDEEREAVIDFLKSHADSDYSDEILQQIERSAQGKEAPSEDSSREIDDADELLPQAVDVLLEAGQASTSMLQRRLKLGYSRASRIIDQLEERGFVGPFEGSKPRQMLVTKDQWQEMKLKGIMVVGDMDSSESPSEAEEYPDSEPSDSEF